MTPNDLKILMQTLGFTSGDVAVLMGVTQRAVQMWLSGSSPVPQSVAILLQAVENGLLPLEWIEDRILEIIRTT